MFTRKTVIALATFAALGTSALAPTSASAWGHGGGHFGGGHFGGGHFGGHFGGHGWGHGFGHWGHGWGRGWGHRYAWGGWRYRNWGFYHRPFAYRYWWNRPYYGVTGGSGYSDNSYQTSEPMSGGIQSKSTGCLVKGYLKDGTVVFTDTCTHESAMGIEEGGQQGTQQGMPPAR